MNSMVGQVVVMEPNDYQAWLAGGATGSLASAGQKLFADLACNTCHRPDAQGRGPLLEHLFGKRVHREPQTRVAILPVRDRHVTPARSAAQFFAQDRCDFARAAPRAKLRSR
jgi:hypothetical protein